MSDCVRASWTSRVLRAVLQPAARNALSASRCFVAGSRSSGTLHYHAIAESTLRVRLHPRNLDQPHVESRRFLSGRDPAGVWRDSTIPVRRFLAESYRGICSLEFRSRNSRLINISIPVVFVNRPSTFSGSASLTPPQSSATAPPLPATSPEDEKEDPKPPTLSLPGSDSSHRSRLP